VAHDLFGSDLWKPALDKYAQVTGLTVELYGLDGLVGLSSSHLTPLFALFREYGFEPGLFAECARHCLDQTELRPPVVLHESHGLTVIGTSLVLDGTIVGAAVGGYALAGFSQVAAVHRWAQSAGMPFDRLWHIARRQAPVPERRLMLHGELLQILGDALLRENHRTRQYETTVIALEAASAAKDEFLAVVSHELRTPLAPILGWASLMKKNQNAEQVHRAAEAIERNALLQSRMVDDLLDVNRISHGSLRLDLEILELLPLLRASLDAVAPDVEKKSIHLELVKEDEPLLVEGDAGRLQQVFRNILSNAVKFTPAEGSIRVALTQEAGSARVVVSDTGIGIMPEFLPFVYEIFRQQERGTRRTHEGLGIGLSLVKRLVESQKGTVTIASAGKDRGTEVTVKLPLAARIPELDRPDPVAAERAASSLEGLSVLVVEDSDDTREALVALFQHLGARVSGARDGREALDMLEVAGPHLVLCDLRMPRMDGYEFMRELHRGCSPVPPPVVALSGLDGDADRRRTEEAGFEAHVKKPFDEATVIAAACAALERRREDAGRPSGLPR
jgi:signal transduction histidine kinase/ActR/RegA family two-component response regulator